MAINDIYLLTNWLIDWLISQPFQYSVSLYPAKARSVHCTNKIVFSKCLKAALVVFRLCLCQ